jgi:hypothetical protein
VDGRNVGEELRQLDIPDYDAAVNRSTHWFVGVTSAISISLGIVCGLGLSKIMNVGSVLPVCLKRVWTPAVAVGFIRLIAQWVRILSCDLIWREMRRREPGIRQLFV